MKRKASQSSFGSKWGLIGSPEKSEVEAVVEAINSDSNLNIGLTAMQLRNLGHGYGKISVKLYDEESTPVEVYNACGANGHDGAKICISRGLADKMELRKGILLTEKVINIRKK